MKKLQFIKEFKITDVLLFAFLIVCLFGLIYHAAPGLISQNDLFNSMFFSVTTFCLASSEIVPVSVLGKLLAAIESIIGILTLCCLSACLMVMMGED